MPMDRKKYPPNWDEISLKIRTAVGWCCEWCGAANGQPNPLTGSKVVLTVAHLDHDTTHNWRSNLAALCQYCHNNYDAPNRAKNAKRTRQIKKAQAATSAGQLSLFKESE